MTNMNNPKRNPNRTNRLTSLLVGIILLCCTSLKAAPVVHQKDPKAGIWGIWDLESEMIPADPLYEGDWLRGSMISVDWEEIKPTKNGAYDWTPLETKLDQGILNLEQAILIVYHGNKAPNWIYNGNCSEPDNDIQDGCVPAVCHKTNNPNEMYPDYVDPDYEIYLKPMITEVANFIQSNQNYSDFITILQCPVGKSGDPNPYDSDVVYYNGYTSTYLGQNSTTWKNWEKNIATHYFDEWDGSGLHMLFKPAHPDTFFNDEPFASNHHQMMMKTAYISHGYQNNKEINNLQDMEDIADKFLIRGELAEPLKHLIGAQKGFNFDDSDDGDTTYRYWNDRPRQNIYWQCLWMLHMGMDIFNLRDIELFEEGLVPGQYRPFHKRLKYWEDARDTFIFFNERAGIKNARKNSHLPLASDEPWKSKYSFIAMREGLAFESTKYVPGPVPSINTTAAKNRFIAIQNAVNADRGADGHVELGDVNSANSNKTPLAYLKTLKAQNDVNWKIYKHNYTMYITQINRDSTSIGYWNMGEPESLNGGQKYGKYARGFKGTKTEMFFNLDNKFISSTANTNPGPGYVIDIVVTYLDRDNSVFKLKYDGDNGETTAYTHTMGDTNTWLTRTFTTTDTRFTNSLTNGSDIILEKVSGNPIFHMIQVIKVDDGTGGGSNPPTITNIADISVNEGDSATVNVTATDPDGNSTITLSESGTPGWANFVDNGNGSGTFTFAPLYWVSPSDNDKTWNITVTADDGTGNTDTESFILTVVNVNRVPILTAIPDTSGDTNTTITVDINAIDNDGDALTLSASGVPSFGSLSDNGDGTGSLTFTPGSTDGGTYTITVTATDIFADEDSDSFILTVNGTNNPPTLTAIADTSVDENASLTVTLSSTDPDSDPITLSATGVPSFGSLTDNGDGSGTIIVNPDYSDSGSYTITVTADDGNGGNDSDSFTLTVNNINQAPSLTNIPDTSQDENSTISVSLNATDPDGDPITLSATGVPSFGNLTDNGNGTGSISFNPDYFDSGSYTITVTANDDNGGTDNDSFTLTVNNINQPPDLNPIADVSMNENTTHIVNLQANDPDGDLLFCTVSNCPSFGVPVDNGDGTGTITFNPGYEDSGSYTMTVVFDDGNGGTDSESFVLTVNNVNRAPSLAAINDVSVDEGSSITVNISASDADQDTITLSASGVPAFGTFTDNGDGTGTIVFNPGSEDAGTSTITITADDGNGGTDSESFVLTVNNVNRAPSLATISDVSVDEGSSITVNISASDADQDTITLSASGVPAFGTFTDNGDGTGTIVFNPGSEDAGTSTITITADDGNGGSANDSFILTVNDIVSGGTETIFEIEDALFIASSGDANVGMQNNNASGSGNPNYMHFKANAVDDYIQYEIDIPAAGDYEFHVGIQHGKNCGIVELKVNANGIIGTQDFYLNGWSFGEHFMGTKSFTSSGKRTLTFTVTGKNVSSNSYKMRLDYIKIVPL